MKPECERIAPLLAGAADDQLEEAEWVELEEHLETCEECQARLDQEQQVVLQLSGLDPAGARNDLWTAVARALPRGVRQRDKRPSWLLALVGLGVLFKPIDLFLLDGTGPLWRMLVLGLVLGLFAVARENPFRLASDEELRSAWRAR